MSAVDVQTPRPGDSDATRAPDSTGTTTPPPTLDPDATRLPGLKVPVVSPTRSAAPVKSASPVKPAGPLKGPAAPKAAGLPKSLSPPKASAQAKSAAASKEPNIGRILGKRYRLEALLGAGGMGVVYRASDLQVPGELFAIKVLKPKLQGHAELVRALREEVRKTRALSHPNIVGAYSISSDEDGDYMLMEYLEGETLQALLDEEFGRGVPFTRAWPFVLDICAALAYAHDHNVIHSDLKPSNVFVTTSGKVKLLDFGIARVARGPIRGFDPGAYGAVTESYASCEMLEGGNPDVRDDVYALGCVVYEMLSGKHPFGRRSATEARDLKLLAPALATLSRRQNAALARALAFDTAQRTPSVEAFKAELEGVRRGRLRWPVLLIAGLVISIIVTATALISRTKLDFRALTLAPQAPGTSVPAPVTVNLVQALKQQATALGVDPADPLLKAGLVALADAQAKARGGTSAEARPQLEKAQASLSEVIRLSPRIVTVGSTPAEIDAALKLCRQETGDSPDCTAQSLADEKARRVMLRPYALDSAPVTNAEFARFAATGYLTAAERAKGLYAAAEKPMFLPGASWKVLRNEELAANAGAGEFPVRGIDYATAKAYCSWRGARLPTEEEWEYAARGPGRSIFPWGKRAEDAPGPEARRLTAVSAQRAAGFFGGRGLGGQVWEWTESGSDSRPILRGPSYLVNVPFYQRLAMRDRENPLHARVDTGVRCATSTEAWPGAAQAAPGH